MKLARLNNPTSKGWDKGIEGKHGTKARLRLNRTITKSYNSKSRIGSNKLSGPTHTPYCLKQPISLPWAGSVCF